MADSILRLRVESDQYDSKIKRAADGLLALESACASSKKSMAQADQESIRFVQSIGQMATVNRSARSSVNELSKAFTDMSMVYSRLSEEEKNSEFGRALSQSIDQLRERAIEARRQLESLGQQLQSTPQIPVQEGGGGLSGMLSGKMGGMLSVFGGNLMTKGVELAASAVTKLTDTLSDAVVQGLELAKEAEGVRMAFDRLDRPGLLDNLRTATHGTIDDLELMKQAVKFDNFGLSLDQMGTLMAFAQQQAKDTGQSIDYLVDSIITGLGRQSLPILDNLGLSSSEIKSRMKETGDMTTAVAAIIKDRMEAAGGYVETAADRSAKAEAEVKNAMLELGNTLLPLEQSANSVWHSIEVGAINLLNNAIRPLIDSLTEAGRLRREVERMNGGGNGQPTMNDRFIGNLKNAREENRKKVREQQLANYDKAIAKKDAELKRLERQQSSNATPRNGYAFQEGAMAARAATQQYNDRIDAIKREKAALVELKKEYAERSDRVLNPKTDTTPTADTTTPKKTTPKNTGGTSGVKKTEEQLNSEAINRLTQEYINAADERKAAIREEIKTLQGRNEEIRRLSDEAQGKDVYPEGSLKDYQKQLSDLTKKQQEATDARQWDEYEKAIEGVNRQIDILKGNLPKDTEATLTMTVDASEVDNLRERIPNATFTKVEAQPRQENLPPLLPSPSEPLWSMPTFDPLAGKPEDTQYTVTVNADTDEAFRNIRSLAEEYDGSEIVINVKTDLAKGQSGLTQQALSDWKSAQQKSLSQQQVGSEDFDATYSNVIDATTLSNVINVALKNGVEIDPGTVEELWDKILGVENIPDETWTALQETINAKLKELGLEPIKIDVDTGNVEQSGKGINASWKAAASAVNAVGSALQGVKQPSVKVAAIIGQAIANIALGFAEATAKSSKLGVFGWIAAIAGGLGTMLGTISAIKSATAGSYAQGGIVPGNDYNDGLTANVSSGELILNKAQQDNIAGLLDQSKLNLHLSASVSAEQIRLVLDSNGRRTGRGEYITKNFS